VITFLALDTIMLDKCRNVVGLVVFYTC